MARLPLAMSLLAIALCAAANAQSKPDGIDPTDVELSRAKRAYETDVASAGKALSAAYDRYEKLIADSPRLSAENRVKLIELLRGDRKAFESEGTVTSAVALRTTANTYRARVAAARRTCERAFDAVAEGLLKGDLAAARAILDAKARHFEKPAAAARKGDPGDDRRVRRFVKEHGSGDFKRL